MKIRASRAPLDAPVDKPTTVYYFDPQLGAPTAKVLPGEYVVTDRDVALVTLLGSCVAACMRDPVAGLGGMNHFMLPEGKLGVATDSARYGSYAMEMLLNDLFKHGARRDRIECKVFGGGSVLRGLTTSNVGEQNARFVHEYLANEHIPVVAEDLLDVHPRKVVYFPRTGRTLVKRLPPTNFGEVGTLEELYRHRLRQAPVVPGGVELF